MVDILSIDNRIKKLFQTELEAIPKYDKRLTLLLSIASQSLNHMRPKIKTDFIEDIKKLKDMIDVVDNFYYYEMETVSLLDDYAVIINTCINQDDMQVNNDKLSTIISRYTCIVKTYFNEKILKRLCLIESFGKKDLLSTVQLNCENCSNSKDFINQDDNLYICVYCNAEILTLSTSSINDISRVNISSKYVYDRKVHFKDCINQYQAKQNTNINPEVYKNIEAQLMTYNIIKEDGPQLERYKKITRSHIIFFLKELGYTKYYEDFILIHYTLTGQPPDNIERLESKLIDDFNLLLETYDNLYKNIKRKNFINAQYVLFQLLRKHNYPCKKDDFAVLKTVERKACHDDICKTLFDALGWEYIYVL